MSEADDRHCVETRDIVQLPCLRGPGAELGQGGPALDFLDHLDLQDKPGSVFLEGGNGSRFLVLWTFYSRGIVRRFGRAIHFIDAVPGTPEPAEVREQGGEGFGIGEAGDEGADHHFAA